MDGMMDDGTTDGLTILTAWIQTSGQMQWWIWHHTHTRNRLFGLMCHTPANQMPMGLIVRWLLHLIPYNVPSCYKRMEPLLVTLPPLRFPTSLTNLISISMNLDDCETYHTMPSHRHSRLHLFMWQFVRIILRSVWHHDYLCHPWWLISAIVGSNSLFNFYFNTSAKWILKQSWD